MDEKPSAAAELPKQYSPQGTEAKWHQYWESQGYFHAPPDAARKPYTIVIPPPNVTGALHLGHALNNTLQDILIRWRRMQGYAALWVPGTDHAGIATQAVVERRLLQEEGVSRHDLGREALVERIWAWKEEYERRILGQLKQMGCSCDWQRTRFTLDEGCARAVRHTFFRFFRDRLIYRGKRLVNWDTYLQTAVSDDEVFHEAVQGHFWHFRYPVVNPQPGEPDHVSIATTRPETMLGDTAVAVHPDPDAALDRVAEELQQKLASASAKERPALEAQQQELERRRKEVLPVLRQLRDMAAAGRKVRLPLAERDIPLVADEWAKPELGSGCVKITPAHDPNDYEVGLRQDLPMVNILRPDGTLNENAGKFAGLEIPAARKAVVQALDEGGYLLQVEDREIDLAHSDRSKTPIEPYLADQWFVKMDDLAQSAMDAVSDGRVSIVPSRYAKGYLDWLGEKRDWPVSRQLWWGHQIPVWYCPGASEVEIEKTFAKHDDVAWQWDEEGQQWLICALEDLPADAIPGYELRQDPDVLDTWFSSALWPHSTLGWPEKSEDLDFFYPTSTLITSRDIITLWVARMVLTGLYNVGDIPFHEVYIHPKILDGYGEGMSKSKGNGVDPVDVIEKFGADSLRFGLAYLTTETQDIRMPVEFECPHCQALLPQTKENRVLPRITCSKCGQDFGTQWSSKPEDRSLSRGAVVSERFELARNFCNKLWNASRFALLNLEGYESAPVKESSLAVEDRWLLSRLSTVAEGITQHWEEYKYADAARMLYGFAWDEFCSFYLEMVKSRLQDPQQRPVAQRVLATALDTLLRLLHPMLPFLTEEIWQRLGAAAPQRGLTAPAPAAESVMIAAWPAGELPARDEAIEQRFAHFQAALGAIREIRSRQNIPPKTQVRFLITTDAATADALSEMEPYFATMAAAEPIEWGANLQPAGLVASVALPGMDVHVDLTGLIDVASERSRNEKELARLQGLIRGKEAKLQNENFVKRAPADVVQKERDALAELNSQLTTVENALSKLAEVAS